MTYLHTIKEFIMTIYHQSNITRFEEVQNNARRAANIVLAVDLPRYRTAKVGLPKEGVCFWAHAQRGKDYGRVCGWVGESPEGDAYKGSISKGRRGRGYHCVHIHIWLFLFIPGLMMGRETDLQDDI